MIEPSEFGSGNPGKKIGKRPKAYLASPYGFSEATKSFMYDALIPAIQECGYHVLNPWDLIPEASELIGRASSNNDLSKQREELSRINTRIGENNAKAIREADVIVAVVDGQEVDSGVAAEIGYAFGLGKKVILGYRGDFRLSGENAACVVNLQVQHFIEKSGGVITRTLDDLKKELRKKISSKATT